MAKPKNTGWRIAGAVMAVIVIIGLGAGRIKRQLFRPTQTAVPQMTAGSVTESFGGTVSSETRVLAEDLNIPWEVIELNDDSWLVTERPGRLVRVTADSRTAVPVAGVAHVGEGGLMGMVRHPEYSVNGWVYLMMTTRQGGGLTNRVVRYQFDETANELSQLKVILEGIPGAANHDGGRLAFGPDGHLYITTGDAQQEDSAQDTKSLAGKILRVTDGGGMPLDNPFNNAVFSYGHRNVQGIAWDEQGRLWASEHGPSGTQSGCDEINLIVKGGNYGWPVSRCEQTREGMISPMIQSGRLETWAPGGVAIAGDVLLFAGLRGEAVYRAKIEGESLTGMQRWLIGEYGRLRSVKFNRGSDAFYLLTSNRDGRGEVRSGDDRLVQIPMILLDQND